MKRSTFIKGLLSGIAALFAAPLLLLAEKSKEDKITITWEEPPLKIRSGYASVDIGDEEKKELATFVTTNSGGEWEYIDISKLKTNGAEAINIK